LVRPPAPSLVRRPSGAEGDTIGGGRAATLSDLTAPLSGFHHAIVDKSGRSVRQNDGLVKAAPTLSETLVRSR